MLIVIIRWVHQKESGQVKKLTEEMGMTNVSSHSMDHLTLLGATYVPFDSGWICSATGSTGVSMM